MPRKELVITSDDLGMSLSVNRGIETAARAGALTSTNFMVPCPWFEHAVQTLQNCDTVDLGIHLTLTCDWQRYTWRPLTGVSSLLNADGRMYPTIAELMQHAHAEDIRNECCAQIELALRRKLPIAYVDLHMCIPWFEPDGCDGGRALNPDYERALMNIVADVAANFGFPYPYAMENDRLKHFRSALSISGKGRSAVERYIAGLTPGIHHLSCHCATATEEQRQLTSATDPALPWALQYRMEDLECITSAWFKSLLAQHRVELRRMPFRSSGNSTAEAVNP